MRKLLLLAALVLWARPVLAQNTGATNIGLTTAPSCTGDANCTLIGHIRYLDKVFADIWNTSAHTIQASGTLTNNGAAPGATNLGVLPMIANASAPSWTEGRQVFGSVDLHGSMRFTPLDSSGAAIPVSDGGSGASSANTMRTIAATDDPTVTTLGGVSDAAATAGGTGSLSAKLRFLTTLSTFGVGATGSAPPANANLFGGVTSGATGGLLAGVPVCDSQGWLNMTTATTTEIAPLVASRTIQICSVLAQAGGTTTMTLKRGTGSDCGTGTTAISPGFELTAQSGFAMGTGLGVVLGSAGAGTVGGATTSANAVCVTSSANVNLHVLIRYAVY